MVEGLFPLVVAATHASTALAAYGIDLIDENQTGAVLLGPFEQIAHPAGAHPHKHFHKLRTGEGEEGHTSFTGNRFGQEGFAGARRAHQQHAFGDLGAHGGEAFRGFQEGHHFLEVLLGLLNPGHIVKFDAGFGFHGKAGLGFAELHRLARASGHAIGAARQKDQRANQQQGEQQVAEQAQHRWGCLGGMDIEADALVLELVHQLWGNARQIDPQPLHAVVEIGIDGFDHRAAAPVKDIDGRDPARIDVIEEAAVAHAGHRRIAGGHGGAIGGSTRGQAGGPTSAEQLPSKEGHHGQGEQPEGNQTPALVHS